MDKYFELEREVGNNQLIFLQPTLSSLNTYIIEKLEQPKHAAKNNTTPPTAQL